MLTPTRRARLTGAWRRGGLPGPVRAALGPVALAYRAGLALRSSLYRWGVLPSGALPRPVLAVGNLTVGGTGKTPLVECLARRLSAEGRRVVILSRGYGGRRASDVAVAADHDGVRLPAAAAGDEPLLLARRLPGVPVVVGRDRLRAGRVALERFHPDLFLLDDAFQHRRLVKDVEVVCLDARAPWGHGGLLPRGNLREPRGALARAALIVLTHAEGLDRSGLEEALRPFAPMAPVVAALHEPDSLEAIGSEARLDLEALRGRRVLGFAGIAAPEDFEATLLAQGAAVVGFVPFPDHYPYDAIAVGRLAERARALSVEWLVTTEKDAVRLSAIGLAPWAGLPVWALRIRLRLIGDEAAWWAALWSGLARRRQAPL